ncbi:hypothetical protein [Pontibacter sp. SGAir0037]|uniref:hypothetical protein n=1 Tax=Pontibacter sp. SGAir0037 TaxID=2571030 RepID=UPI0010CD3CE1|nr:hypothetical protein [Pontibacter sp. SGAir0037]QCR20918.1 hypothetical protein C1N53_00110 [Pontibacter sp. SGAir0037]
MRLHQKLQHSPLLAIPFLLLLSRPVKAQEWLHNFKAYNSVYLELGGNGDAYSINYDLVYYQNWYFKAAARVGVGTNLFFLPEQTSVYPVVPVEAIGMVGRKRKHFEFGLGYTHRFTDAPEEVQQMYFGRIGFRYQVPLGGLLVRVGATPYVSPSSSFKSTGVAVVPRYGLSMGYSF